MWTSNLGFWSYFTGTEVSLTGYQIQLYSFPFPYLSSIPLLINISNLELMIFAQNVRLKLDSVYICRAVLRIVGRNEWKWCLCRKMDRYENTEATFNKTQHILFTNCTLLCYSLTEKIRLLTYWNPHIFLLLTIDFYEVSSNFHYRCDLSV